MRKLISPKAYSLYGVMLIGVYFVSPGDSIHNFCESFSTRIRSLGEYVTARECLQSIKGNKFKWTGKIWGTKNRQKGIHDKEGIDNICNIRHIYQSFLSEIFYLTIDLLTLLIVPQNILQRFQSID